MDSNINTDLRPLDAIESAIEDIKQGKVVIVVDDDDRENEGDLVLAAEFVTPDAINVMARHGRGLICLTLTEEKCHQLNLPPWLASQASAGSTNRSLSSRRGRTKSLAPGGPPRLSRNTRMKVAAQAVSAGVLSALIASGCQTRSTSSAGCRA